MRDSVERCKLDLRGLVVLTEAATGAYAVTPVLCAMAGARKVAAVTAPSRFGSVTEVSTQTMELAELARVGSVIEIVTEKSKERVEQADIITNSGHVRPIDARMISWLKPTAVISLMYEAWELRPMDVDLAACRERKILVGGVNERHPAVDVFSYLGMMASKLLMDAGVAVRLSRILLVCDCPFRESLQSGLASAGAAVDTVEDLSSLSGLKGFYDAILVALRPQSKLEVPRDGYDALKARWPGVVVAQFIGDIDRDAFAAAGVHVWPSHSPPSGHMGILPSDIGPEPIVRLQAGGLKAAQVMAQRSSCSDRDALTFVDPLYF